MIQAVHDVLIALGILSIVQVMVVFGLYCSIHNDPHVKPFESNKFEHQEIGEFLLYSSDDYVFINGTFEKCHPTAVTTCTKSLKFFFYNSDNQIEIKRSPDQGFYYNDDSNPRQFNPPPGLTLNGNYLIDVILQKFETYYSIYFPDSSDDTFNFEVRITSDLNSIIIFAAQSYDPTYDYGICVSGNQVIPSKTKACMSKYLGEELLNDDEILDFNGKQFFSQLINICSRSPNKDLKESLSDAKIIESLMNKNKLDELTNPDTRTYNIASEFCKNKNKQLAKLTSFKVLKKPVELCV